MFYLTFIKGPPQYSTAAAPPIWIKSEYESIAVM